MAGNIVGGGAINATSNAAVLSANVGSTGVLIQCYSSSPASLLVGWGSGQFIEIEPGEEMEFSVSDVSGLYVRADGDAAAGGWLAIREG